MASVRGLRIIETEAGLVADEQAHVSGEATGEYLLSAQSGSANVFVVQTDSGYPDRGDDDVPRIWIGWDDPTDLMDELDMYVPIPEPA